MPPASRADYFMHRQQAAGFCPQTLNPRCFKQPLDRPTHPEDHILCCRVGWTSSCGCFDPNEEELTTLVHSLGFR